MNCDVDGVAPRPRPLSGGLWTLLSWLRRDERKSSSESLSSAGSDRTAASFAFLTPAHYSVGNTTSILPTIGPPTDSYKKRLHERNLRRQHERDLTLHRKYGLYRSEGGTGYDTFTLQHRRTEGDSIGKWSRERRATSECLQRRPVHVPGKRRAPLPPVCSVPSSGALTLARRTRKRPAPQPPLNILQTPKEITTLDNISVTMNSKLNCDDKSMPIYERSEGCKSEKYVKKDINRKDKKSRSETSFLKHIFENRKKNSPTELASVKILPSISELDKQAAEIIENGKLRALEKNVYTSGMVLSNVNAQGLRMNEEYWFCTKCLKKYNASVKECNYCFPETKESTKESANNLKPHLKNEIYTQTNNLGSPSTTINNRFDDKQKLKEILKEMKDSLPKKSKRESDNIHKMPINLLSKNNTEKSSVVSETPTLRIGSSIDAQGAQSSFNGSSTVGAESKIMQLKDQNTKPVKLKDAINLTNVIESVEHSKTTEISSKPAINEQDHNKNTKKVMDDKESDISYLVSNSSEKKDLHTPLRISSLLNPVYIPKNKASIKKSSNDILSPASSSLVNNESLTNKCISKVQTTITEEGVSSTSTQRPGFITQVLNLKIDTPKFKLNSNESHPTLKDKVKVNNLNLKVQSKNTALPNNISPAVKEELKLKSIESYGNEKKRIDPSLTPSSSMSSCSKAKILLPNLEKVNQHARRRELVNQLEKSIAKGDEHAAADAAAKLAQLRLSCSVLSFSSQIVTDPLPSSTNNPVNTNFTTQMTKDSVLNSNSIFKNENTKTTVQLPIENAEKSTSQLHRESTNEIKLDQRDKQQLPPSTVQNAFLNGKTVMKTDDGINQLKLHSKSKSKGNDDKRNVTIQIWIEDKKATRGPIYLNTQRQALMRELGMQAEAEFGLPTRLQRWIVGRTLCTDDNIPIATLAGSDFNAPFYLCLVESGKSDRNMPNTTCIQVDEKQNAVKTATQKIEKKIRLDSAKAIGQNTVDAIVQDTVKIMIENENQVANVYKELVKLEQQALVPNAETFECGVCMDEYPPDRGVILRECVHMFCRSCLSDLVRHCEDPNVLCPAMGCQGVLQEREIRALVTAEDYERWLARGLAAAESGTRNAFHCRTRDCNGWALCDPGVQKFPCPVCKHTNCVPCQAIHEGETCDKYRTKLQSVTNVGSDEIDGSTRALIDTLINKGEALECPECKAVITKKWGCDWVKCSACKTEICWVTRGRRWGPAGRGDISSGCRCGVDGKKCHPSCGYCH